MRGRCENLRRQALLREILGIQGNNEIGFAGLRTAAEGLVIGIGGTPTEDLGATNSASSLIRFTIRPISPRLTWSLASTSLYSSTTSSDTSHVNV
jgi:hypothetical protein